MEDWAATADKVKDVEGFAKNNLTNKSAQARFNDKSEKVSGVSEEYTEKRQLLDELLCAIEKHLRSEALRIRDAKDKVKADDDVSKVMRNAAVCRLKDRKVDNADNSTKRRRLNVGTVIDLIREDSEKEREEQQRRWKEQQKERAIDQEMKERQWNEERQDREEERKYRLELARLEGKRLDQMLQLATMKSPTRTAPTDQLR